jgi:hypothetical protein
MLSAVEFDAQTGLYAIKVQDIAADGVLAAELEVLEHPTTK